MRNGANDGLVTAHPNEENWGVAHRTLLPAFGELHVQDMFDGKREDNFCYMKKIYS